MFQYNFQVRMLTPNFYVRYIFPSHHILLAYSRNISILEWNRSRIVPLQCHQTSEAACPSAYGQTSCPSLWLGSTTRIFFAHDQSSPQLKRKEAKESDNLFHLHPEDHLELVSDVKDLWDGHTSSGMFFFQYSTLARAYQRTLPEGMDSVFDKRMRNRGLLHYYNCWDARSAAFSHPNKCRSSTEH